MNHRIVHRYLFLLILTGAFSVEAMEDGSPDTVLITPRKKKAADSIKQRMSRSAGTSPNGSPREGTPDSSRARAGSDPRTDSPRATSPGRQRIIPSLAIERGKTPSPRVETDPELQLWQALLNQKLPNIETLRPGSDSYQGQKITTTFAEDFFGLKRKEKELQEQLQDVQDRLKNLTPVLLRSLLRNGKNESSDSSDEINEH